MPQRDAILLMKDAVEACDVIAKCVECDRDEYLSDVIRRSAVERQCEIIGEAIRRLISLEAGLTLRLPESSEIIDFRNFLAHGYHLVDHSIVWTTDAPRLWEKLRELIAERPGVIG